MVSWNVQRVPSGLSTLVQHISEFEEWDAILLQELVFKDEFIVGRIGGFPRKPQISEEPEMPVGHTAIIIHWRRLQKKCADPRTVRELAKKRAPCVDPRTVRELAYKWAACADSGTVRE